MAEILNEFNDWVSPLMTKHLVEDILPYWTQDTLLGTPFGKFPTYASQSGTPDYSRPIFVRMHGRQTYGYLAASILLGRKDLFQYGLSGLKQLEKYENPAGGYYSTIKPDGSPGCTPISIQDQCYSALPYVMAFRLTKDFKFLKKMFDFINFINSGPYLNKDGSYKNALNQDLKKEVFFETEALNIVSVIDFLNAVLIPTFSLIPLQEVTDNMKIILIKWLKLMVDEFYGEGIFWNDRNNRTNWQGKHVDLGHTSKAYKILYNANLLLKRWGMPQVFLEIMPNYPKIIKAAVRPTIGWATDFDNSLYTFRIGNTQWWRHILINQTVYLYANIFPELIPLLKQGVLTWLSCDYVDRTRDCRGIRDCLDSNGKIISNKEQLTYKANFWKSAYHEVEHVLTFCGLDL